MTRPQPTSERRQPSVEATALLEGVRQFTESNRELTAAVHETFAARRRGWIVGVAIAALLLLQGFGILAVQRHLISNSREAVVQRDNQQRTLDKQQQTLDNVVRLLNDVEAVTNPQAQARSQAAQAQIVAEIVLCIENHQDVINNPNVPLRAGCPGGP